MDGLLGGVERAFGRGRGEHLGPRPRSHRRIVVGPQEFAAPPRRSYSRDDLLAGRYVVAKEAAPPPQKPICKRIYRRPKPAAVFPEKTPRAQKAKNKEEFFPRQ